MTEGSGLVDRLRDGDEAAYREVVRLHHAGLVRLAQAFCGVRATAEEVVQDAWVAVFTGIDGYVGAAPLRSWIAGIVVNLARKRGVRDGRMRSFSDLAWQEAADGAPAPDSERFRADGAWADPPTPWDGLTPEREVGGRQMLEHLAVAVEALPPAQRAVVLLCDVEGHDAAEVCRMLDITHGNMRVLLHRARARLRARMEALARTEAAGATIETAAWSGGRRRGRPL